jgi:hypothetical protein
MATLTNEQANAVYSILVEECGAPDGQRVDFVYHATTQDGEHGAGLEWRFQGSLGFGGKYYHHAGRQWVDCYTEDETPERLASIQRAEARLGQVKP